MKDNKNNVGKKTILIRMSEKRLREIIREEIIKYHHETFVPRIKED